MPKTMPAPTEDATMTSKVQLAQSRFPEVWGCAGAPIEVLPARAQACENPTMAVRSQARQRDSRRTAQYNQMPATGSDSLAAKREAESLENAHVMTDAWRARQIEVKIDLIVEYLLWLDSGAMPNQAGWRNERLAKGAHAFLAEHLSLEDDWTEVTLDFLENHYADVASGETYLARCFKAENARALVRVEQAERKCNIFRRSPNMCQGRLLPLRDTGVDNIEEIRRQHMLRVLNGFDSARAFVAQLDDEAFHDYLWNNTRLPWWTMVWRELDKVGEDKAAAVARQDPLMRLLFLRA